MNVYYVCFDVCKSVCYFVYSNLFLSVLNFKCLCYVCYFVTCYCFNVIIMLRCVMMLLH